MTPIKVFLSYSTDNADHQNWVRTLANKLRSHGIDTTFDQHDLKAGQDMYAFMETIVDHAKHAKVVILSDASYTERANVRKGGVGAEIQVLTPAVYGDIGQTRVIPVFTERFSNGEPTLPTFLKNRYALDFSDPDHYDHNYALLYLAITNTPLHEKAPLGQKPDLDAIRKMGARKTNTSKQQKNIVKKNLEDIDNAHIGDKNDSTEDDGSFTNKNIVEGDVKRVKNFRLGDDY
jgi:hypothetical protein